MATEGRALRVAIQDLARAKKGRRYPPELRERVTRYAQRRLAAGVGVTQTCAELDIGEPTLGRFLAGRPKSASFAPVVVRDSRVPATASRFVVRGPNGLRVEGLGIEELAELVRRLSCSA